MNKLITFFFCLSLTMQAFAGDKVSFLKKQFTAKDGYQLNYRVLYPLHYSPDKSCPVILFLHGAGERGEDNEKQLTHGGDLFASYETQSSHLAIIIAPQCPSEYYWSTYTRPSASGQKREFPYAVPITPALNAVKELLDSYIQKGIVDTDQIHIAGLSMGAIGSFDLVRRYPNFFRTATPICGGANLDRLKNFKGKTIFRIYHGSADDTVDVIWSRDAYETLKNSGKEVYYKEYPGVNHDSWNHAFAEPDFISWMFEQQ